MLMTQLTIATTRTFFSIAPWHQNRFKELWREIKRGHAVIHSLFFFILIFQWMPTMYLDIYLLSRLISMRSIPKIKWKNLSKRMNEMNEWMKWNKCLLFLFITAFLVLCVVFFSVVTNGLEWYKYTHTGTMEFPLHSFIYSFSFIILKYKSFIHEK